MLTKRIFFFKLLLVLIFCVGTFCLKVFSQTTVKVNGVVKDRLDKPLVNVNVTVQNKKTTGTITNAKGEFSLEVSTNDVLVFSYVGFTQVIRPVSNSIYFDVIMDAKQGSEEEVVVVGFGKAKKISLVGAQSSVNVQDLKQPVANISTLLAGRVAGLIGVQRSGLPGGNTGDLFVRGIATFGNNPSGALIVIDGIQGRDLNTLDPEDVASLTILKDASATAVYGVAGANGVILITTKKGRSGKTVLKFNYNQGFTDFTKLPELVGGIDYMNLTNEARIASGLTAQYSQAYIDSTASGKSPYAFPNVDWMKTIFKDRGLTRRVNFSASGGAELANFYIGLAYYDEQSLLRGDNTQAYKSSQRFKRYNFTSNINMAWTKTTNFDLGIQGIVSEVNTPGIGAEQAFREVMQTTPVLYPVEFPGGLVSAVNSANAQRNPYEEVTQTGFTNNFNNRFYSNIRITQSLNAITKGLSAYALYAFDAQNEQLIQRIRSRNTYRIADPFNAYNADGSLKLQAVNSNGSDNLGYGRLNGGNRTNNFEGAVTYSRTFNKDHAVTGLLLYTQQSFINSFSFDLIGSLPFRRLGLVGRATYGFQDKYFAEVNFGYNGSENFAPENRFGFFPSFGVGWVVSKEKFYEPISNVIQFLKFRYSDGVVGSGAGGRRYGYRTIVVDNAGGYTFGAGNQSQASAGVLVTDYGVPVKWSESRKQNFGVEFKILSNKISVIMDFFKERRTGIFLGRGTVPAYVGLVNSPNGNLGELVNQGFDATVESTPITIAGDLKVDFRGTITYNRNKVIENDQPLQQFGYLNGIGYNSLSQFGFTALGLFTDQKQIDNSADQSFLGNPRPGDIRYKDLNSDGLIDILDRQRIGNGDIPDWIYGMGANLTFKNFYLGVFFQGTEGATRILGGDGILPFSNGTGPERSNLFAAAKDRWTVNNPNPNATYPRLGYGNNVNRNNNVASTWWLRDVDFLRLKTVAFGYNLPASLVKKAGFRTGQIYVQGFNLLYWSKFKLWDPELNTNNGTNYPNTRNYSVGFQFSL